jgi:hypothetical protein
MKKILMALSALAVACGNGVVSNKQENSEPTGIVTGRVLDASNGAPLAGVQVGTFINGTATTVATDGSGRYQLGPIPAGTYTLFGDAQGYVRRLFNNVTVAGEAGDFPTENLVVTRDFDMAKGDATIDGVVVTSTNAPANGATAFVDLRGSGYDLVASSKADTAGRFKFTGLPGSAAGFSVTVNVAPYDENGDGAPDFLTNSRTYTLFPAFTSTGPITISAIGVPVLTSTIGDSDLAPTESIVMTFGAPVRANQSTFTLTRNSIGFTVGLNVSWDTARTTVTVSPAGGPLVEGQNYTFSWNVRADNNTSSSNSQSFVVRAAPTQPVAPVTNFRITAPTPAVYDSSLSSVTVAWNAVSGAAGYRLYVKDTQLNPAYLALTSFSSAATTGAVSLSTGLFGGNTGVLSNGNKVTLALVAVDREGNEGKLSSAPTLDLIDTVPPTVIAAGQISGMGTANNAVGTVPISIRYQVVYNEAMLQSASPVLGPSLQESPAALRGPTPTSACSPSPYRRRSTEPPWFHSQVAKTAVAIPKTVASPALSTDAHFPSRCRKNPVA